MDYYSSLFASKLNGGGGGGVTVEPLSVTENGAYQEEGKAYSPVNVNVPSAISLLNTVTVSEDVRGVSVDVSAYSSYDMLIIFEDVTLSASDYLYYADNIMEPSTGSYSSSASVNHKGWCGYVFNLPPTKTTRRSGKLSNANFTTVNTMNNLYIYTYIASTLIKAGSVFKIYGGNYADM